MARDDYSTIRIRPSVVDQLRRLVRQLAAEADQDVTQTDALGAAIGYAFDHLGDVAARLPGEPAREGSATEADSAPGGPRGAATETETQQ
jgi:CRISPR/Cas system-associated protein Csm6